MRLSFVRAIFCAGLIFLQVQPAHAETLEQVLTTAYDTNPGLAAARAKLRAADEQVARALSGWRPDISATAEDGVSRQRVSGNGVEAQEKSLTPLNTTLNVTQPLFSGFRTTAQVASAEAAVKAERAVLQDTEQKLFLDTSKAYLAVVQAEAVLSISKDIELALQKQLEQVQERLQIGELKKTDVAQAQSRLKAATVSRLQAEGDLLNQRATFARLVGRMPGSLEPPHFVFALPKTEDEASAIALQNSPSVIAASFGADAAQADIAATKGALLPSVDLVGSASHARDQSLLSAARQDSGTILARLTVPLYRTGEDYAKTRAAQQTALQRRLELDDARNKAREEALTAWQSLATARAARTGRQEVATATADALEGVKTEAKFGTRTTLDVLNAEQELYNAKINLARATYDESFTTLQLKAAVGGLTAAALRLPVELYDPLKNYSAVRNKWVGFSPSPPAPKAWAGEGRGEGGGAVSANPASSAQMLTPPHPPTLSRGPLPLPPLSPLAGEREQSDKGSQ